VSQGGRARALCILGVHRSGTSAITRAFNLYGAFVGEGRDLMPETAANPEGYWERNDLCAFHERLLAAVRRRWDTGLGLPAGWQRAPALAPLREELKRTVGAAFAGRPLWAWKDPRTCLLLEIWKEVLEELGVQLQVVFVLRHPADVAASLGKRDGFGAEKSFGVWVGHTLAALSACEGVQTAFIGYDAFLEDPDGQVRRCAAALGIPAPEGADDACAAIRAFARPELRHSRADAAALAAAPAPVRELHELVERALAGPEACDGAFFARVRQVREAHAAHAGFFREDLERCLDTAARLSGMETRCREYQARAGAAVQQAAEAGQRAQVAEQQARVAEEQVRVAREQAAAALRRAEEQVQRHDAARIAAERAFEQIAGSLIWRLSAPVRRLADLLRGG
jgi:hypothetical protein